MMNLLVYTVPDFAKEIKTAKDNVYILCDLGIIKTMSFGSRGKTISVYEAERFLKENAGRDFTKIVEDEKKRRKLIEESTNIVEMRERR